MTSVSQIASAVLLVATCAGCFSSVPQTRSWTVTAVPSAVRPAAATPASFAATRLGSVSVLAPGDARGLVVRRADGSLARDPYNVFLAAPAVLLRAPALALVTADGRFGHVLDASSSASVDAVLEFTVTDLSLDCAAKPRAASVAVAVTVVRADRGPRTVVLAGTGSARADASAGDYSAAFSRAFSDAARAALASLK